MCDRDKRETCCIKICGLRQEREIAWVNELRPEYVGFVFVPGSKRYVNQKQAHLLRERLNPGIVPVGVFMKEEPGRIVELLDAGIIEAAQLHGAQEGDCLRELRERRDCMIFQAFCIQGSGDIRLANESQADYVLLDSGCGAGKAFDWSLISEIRRPYFLAGGLSPENVRMAIDALHPMGVDASSGLEADGCKDRGKMEAFVRAVRRSRADGSF